MVPVMIAEACTHVPDPQATPRSDVCEDCGADFNLRMCAECGYVGCCESQLAHDRDHALGKGHPVIRSLPITAASFTWCYACGRYL
jgi:monovalent cation/hydrogen antiporter